MRNRKAIFRMVMLLCLITTTLAVQASTVSELSATLSNGQVFLTWKNPSGSNLKYKVYRSSTKITNESQLTNENYLGYVRDNSGQNLRKSLLQLLEVPFSIPVIGQLSSNRGLYVVSCDDNKRHFYIVTVVNLSNNVEDKTIIPGVNCLITGFKEHKGTPQPVLQGVVYQPNGDVNYEYILWGNNQDLPNYPAFNNCGSFAYNFTLVNRNAGTASPLFVKFDDDDPFKKLSNEYGDNCNILQLDDWLPNGDNSYWVGYNVNYDIYSPTNPELTSGIIRTYTLNKTRKIMEWCVQQPTVDPTRVYAEGYSHNGYGMLFSTLMMPGMFAATQENSSPILIKACNGTMRETQWCASNQNLKSDIVYPNTNDTMLIWDLLDIRTLLDLNYFTGNPYMTGIHGKQDKTVGWVDQFNWFDNIADTRHGGVWFWDQRDHPGNGKDFNTEETSLDWLRFSTVKSYPAFSHCTIDQDPGNGSASSGDPYGAINGYLDWEDNSINDEECGYSITCFIKDFYVGGVKQASYNECSADVTVRRLQNFKPAIGQTVTWKVQKGDVVKQQGSFVYDGEPITLENVKIYKAGSDISFNIEGCLKTETTATGLPLSSNVMTVARTGDGYDVAVGLKEANTVEVKVIDMAGRIIRSQVISMNSGDNLFSVNDLTAGTYLLHLTGENISESAKLLF